MRHSGERHSETHSDARHSETQSDEALHTHYDDAGVHGLRVHIQKCDWGASASKQQELAKLASSRERIAQAALAAAEAAGDEEALKAAQEAWSDADAKAREAAHIAAAAVSKQEELTKQIIGKREADIEAAERRTAAANAVNAAVNDMTVAEASGVLDSL